MSYRVVRLGVGAFILLPSISTLNLFAAETVEPVVVTATRTAQTADQALASVTVINREDIERTQAKTLSDILRNLAGIDVANSGGIGKAESIFIRGTNSDHVLVLVDGVRAGSATLGTFAWQNFSPDQIEKIEVVRGPRAALYGSDAIGGVIQIFTRKNSGNEFSVSKGTHNTAEEKISLGGGKDNYYSLQAGKLTTDGISISNKLKGKYGYTNTNATLRGGVTITKTARLDGGFTQSYGKNRLDVDTGDLDFRNQVANLKFSDQIDDFWNPTLQTSDVLDRSVSYSPYTPGTITTRRRSINLQNDVHWQQGVTTAGIEQVKDHATKDNSGEIDRTLRNNAFYIQHQHHWDIYDILVGQRHDDNNNYGKHNTWNAAVGMETGATRYFISAGTAFKAPTVNALYWPYSSSVYIGNTYIEQGNPNLAPERSHSYELGMRHKLSDKTRFEANLYYTRLSDLIVWVSTPTGPNQYTYQPQNINNASIRGLEMTWTSAISNWELAGNFTATHATDDSTGRQLDRRPKEQLKLQATYQQDTWRWHNEAIYASQRLDNQGASRLEPYTLFNTTAMYQLSKQSSLNARVENVFNAQYVLATSFSGDYVTYGRTLYISLSHSLP
ncbi:MAG: TonB-dependent receptor [Gammaproteobacteria bacterium]|nr:TonB-dependent receptor [Gammaproteobacteria bacterium]